ncbi:iron ABC transporter permease [Betaproteobacteria bacterium]|nr:iron ABC transporter permease [Betaproteobacteria bacterium]
MNATRRKHSFATTSFVLLGLLISAPTIGIFVITLSSGEDILLSLQGDVAVSQLLTYFKNTVILCISTALLSVSYSIPVAWCLAFYSFRGKRLIEILVILPMAMPAYILAYAYTDALDYSGWVATLISEYLVHLGLFNDIGDTKYIWPEIRSIYFASFLLAMSFSPYLVLITRRAFQGNYLSLIDAAKTMGATSKTIFFSIILPLTRPAILAASLLVAMECLSDFGTVYYFSIQTLSTGLYKAWLGYGDMTMTSLLAIFIFLIAISLALGDRFLKPEYYRITLNRSKSDEVQVVGVKSFLLVIFLSMSGLFGFLVPFIFLLKRSVEEFTFTSFVLSDFYSLIESLTTTIFLASTATMIILTTSLVTVYVIRSSSNKIVDSLAQIFTSNYAVAGLVSALALLTLAGYLTKILPGYLLMGEKFAFCLSMTLLLIAYLSRYFAVGHSSLDTSFKSITKNIDYSSSTLGLNPMNTFFRLHLRLLKPSIIIAGTLIFLDIVKELPATLVLRPLDIQTLAISAYSFAADEELGLAAIPSLAMVAIVVPIVFFLRKQLYSNG